MTKRLFCKTYVLKILTKSLKFLCQYYSLYKNYYVDYKKKINKSR